MQTLVRHVIRNFGNYRLLNIIVVEESPLCLIFSRKKGLNSIGH